MPVPKAYWRNSITRERNNPDSSTLGKVEKLLLRQGRRKPKGTNQIMFPTKR
jgi:hypothetical protein